MEVNVSVIVAIYNVAPYLERCLNSFANQTYQEYEVLLIDDGSTDSSAEICATFARLPRFSYFYKTNGGLSDARNFGLEQAQGKYILFFDGDDWAEPDFLKTMVTVSDRQHLDVSICGLFVDTVNQMEQLLDREEQRFFSQPCVLTYANLPLTASFIQKMGFVWNKLYRREFLEEHRLQFEKGLSLIEDSTFNCQVWQLKPTVGFVEEALTHYMQRPRVTLKQGSVKNKALHLRRRALIQIEDWLETWGFDSLVIQRTMADVYVQTLKYSILESASNQDREYQQSIFEQMQTPYHMQYLNNYQHQSVADRLVLLLMKKKQLALLVRLSQLKKETSHKNLHVAQEQGASEK